MLETVAKSGTTVRASVARTVAFVVCLIVMSGCTPLKTEVNKRWPPLDLAAATEKASTEALSGLGKMDRADVYIGVSDGTIQTFAPRAIMNAEPRVKALELKLGQQAIIFDIDFKGDFPDLGFSAAGDIRAAAVPSIDGLKLKVRPVAQHVHLDSLKLRKNSILKDMEIGPAADLVIGVLNTFIDNINGQIATYETKLEFASTIELRAEDMLAGLPDARNFTGAPYAVTQKMEYGSVFIDDNGLHALVQSKLSREETEPSDQRQLQQLDSTSSYEAFSAAFRELGRRHMGPDLDARWADTAAAASNQFVAAVVNTGLHPIGFGADFTIAPQAGQFDDLLEIETTWDFDCSQSGMDCSMSHIDCSGGRDCDPRWNCPSCKWYQADCHARKLGCEADKVRFRTQCNIENATRKAICDADKLAKKAACEVVKAAKKVGCELNKAWLQMVNGADIGRLKGDYSLSATVGNAFLHGATVREGMERIELDTTVKAQSTVRLAAKFTPYDLIGHLACQAETNFNLETGVKVKPQLLSLAANKTGADFEIDRLNLKYRTEERMVTISTEEPPMLKLTLLNPDFLIKCTPTAALVTVGTILKEFRQDLVRTDYEIKIDPFDFEIGIPSFNVPVFEGNISYRPVRSTTALWFEGRSAASGTALRNEPQE